VPVLGFILESSAEWPHSRYETVEESKEALQKFKIRARSRPVGFWRTAEDLGLRVAVALMKAFNTSPRPGWIRNLGGGPQTLVELTRLSSENARLRDEIAALQGSTKVQVLGRLSSLLETGKSLPRKMGGLGSKVIEPSLVAGWLSSVRSNVAAAVDQSSPYYLALSKENLHDKMEFTEADVDAACEIIKSILEDFNPTEESID
jgi:hypothetical protein